MNHNDQVSRRDFIKVSIAGVGALTVGACSSGQSSQPTQNVVLKHWDWYVTQGPWLDQEIKLFQQANPGITIKKTTHVADKYAELFGLAAKSGDIPDVFMLPPAPDFETQVKQKWLYPISDFSDYNAFMSTFPNPSLNFVPGSNISRATNKTYSAPFGGPEPNIELWVNTKVFKDSGLVDSSGNVQIPKTMDDMLSAARVIKQKSGGKVYGYGFGGKLPYNDIWLIDLVTTLSSNGSLGGQNFKTGKFDFADNPVYNSAINWLLSMKKEGHIIPDSSSVDDEGIRFLFSQHKFGMLFGGIWVINGWKQTNPGFSEYTMDHAPLIGTSTPQGAYYTGPGGTNFGISAKTKNQDAAWKWFKWLYSKEAGERWVKAGNGTSVFPEALKDEYAQNDAMRNFFRLSKTLVKVGPQLAIRNPDTGKVSPAAVNPSADQIVRGAYTGQITDVAGALRTLQDKSQKALEQGIKDALSAGARVSMQDYIFPDWDPTKDYITKPGK